jgi:predicted enzyme related to lactoylglutathione lyase
MTHHRSRVVQFVIDVDNLDRGVAFWSAALDATEEPLSEQSRHVYRLLRLPDAEIRVLLQRTHDEKVSKERMHLDLETDDVEAEVRRLEALGATRYDHQQERGFDFWVMRDPWGNEFCVLQPNFPELLARRRPWTTWGGSSGLLSPQLTACFTSAAILASTSGVNSVSAKEVGHMAPSSRFAMSLKPNVAYLSLNFDAGVK